MRDCYFFDMDSTLLEMDQDQFIYVYFKAIQEYIAKEGYNVKEFMDDFNKAVYLLLKNDGKCTNEEFFFNIMGQKYDVKKLNDTFMSFYNGPYLDLKYIVKKTNNPREIIDKLKKKNKRLILATAPIFPKIAIESRLRWSGLEPSDFEIITDYSNSSFCKPKKEYYQEILNRLNLKPTDCYMVGNDLDDDFCDLPLGFEKILITDYMLNRKNKEINPKDFYLISTLSEFNNSI